MNFPISEIREFLSSGIVNHLRVYGTVHVSNAVVYATELLEHVETLQRRIEELEKDLEHERRERLPAPDDDDPVLDINMLSVRLANVLNNGGVSTFGQFRSLTVGQFLRLKSAGRKTLQEANGILDDYGLPPLKKEEACPTN